MTKNQQLIEQVVDAYVEETGNTQYTKPELAAWAIDNGRWQPSLKSQIELLCDELTTAMRAERKMVDGRKVRQFHCVRTISDGYVQAVWAHIDVATQPFMEASFARRRKNIVSNAFQLYSDVAYWNENKNVGEPIQILLDLTDDIADLEHAQQSGQDVSLEEDEETQETD